MNGRVGLLGGLLLVQLVIVAVLLWNQNRDAGAVGTFLDFDAKSVDRIVIADASESIELKRKDGAWTVGDAPADATKADKLVNDFASFRSPWPVANTTSSAERFEVTEKKFQRRITFHAGDKIVGDVLLGTSPGFQRVHARSVGSDDIHSINFSNFQAATKADDWLDKGLLAADGAVKSVVAPAGFSLIRDKEGWLLDGGAANQDTATTYAERFENLRIIGVASEPGANDKGTFTVTDGKGEYTLQLTQGTDANDYIVVSSRREGAFKVAAYIAEQMLEDKEELLPKAAEPEAAEPEASAASAVDAAVSPAPEVSPSE